MTDPSTKPLALVTGASRGIGAATATLLAAKGYHVILTARTDGGLEATEAAIHEAGGTSTIAPFDITDGDAIDRLAAAIANRWRSLDILMLNAALLGELMPVAHVEPKDFDKIFATNVLANHRLLRAFDSLLRASSDAHVVALTSSVASDPRAYWGAYAASKAALENMIQTYGLEVAAVSKIKTHSFNPGGTATSMRAKAYPGENPSMLKTPEAAALEIAAMIGLG